MVTGGGLLCPWEDFRRSPAPKMPSPRSSCQGSGLRERGTREPVLERESPWEREQMCHSALPHCPPDGPPPLQPPHLCSRPSSSREFSPLLSACQWPAQCPSETFSSCCSPMSFSSLNPPWPGHRSCSIGLYSFELVRHLVDVTAFGWFPPHTRILALAADLGSDPMKHWAGRGR